MKFQFDRNSVGAVSRPSPMPWRWSQITCTKVLKKVWITVIAFLCCATVEDLASGLDVHSSPEVHAVGSTVGFVSGVTEMSNSMWSLPRAVAKWTLREQRNSGQCR